MAAGGSIECLEELLSHCQSEEEKACLFTDEDEDGTIPAYHAIARGKHRMTDYLLQKMNKQQKTNLFKSSLLFEK